MIRLAILLTLLTTITANAFTQEMLMRRAYGVRGNAVLEIGNAVDLDGSTEYLTDSSTSLLNGATSMTVSCWVYVSALSGYAKDGIITHCTLPPTYPYGGINTMNSTKQFSTFIYTSSGGDSGVNSATNAISTGTWQFVTTTWQAGSGVKLYVDNSAALTGNAVGGTIQQGTVFRLGAPLYFTPTAWGYLTGKIDELAIFKNRTLTASEISELYNNGVGKPVQQLSTGTAGLVRLWHLDESGSATNAYDSALGTTATGTEIGTGDWVTGKVVK